MSGAGARAPRACGVRARARMRAVSSRFSRGGVCPEGLGAPLRAPPPLRRAGGGCLPPAPPVPGSPLAGGARARVGAAWLREALPWGVAPGWTERMEVGDGLPRRGSRGSGPQGRALWGGAWLVGRLAKGAEAGWRRGRRGTALVLVAVGSRARLPGGLVRVSVGAPFPEPVPSSARALSGPRFVRVPPPRTLRPTSRSVLLFFSPSVSARTTERASAPSPLPPPSPCRARDQASPLVGCPPPPWAAMALGGPGPGRSAVGPARVSEGMGGRREKGALAARVGGPAGAGRGWWVAARAGERSRGRSRGCCGWQGRRALCEGLPQGSPRGRAGSASGGATGPPLCWRPRAVGPRAHPGGDLAPPPQGAWLETRGAPLPLARGPVPRRSSPAPRCPCRQASVSWPPPFGYQTRWRALVCGRFPGPLRPPLRVRRHRPARRRCCVQTGGIVRPLPPPCPPPPPALARARLGVGRVPACPSLAAPRPRAPAPPVEGCPGLGPAPAPRERVRRPAVPASARPVRGSVPRSRAATGLLGVGARWRGGRVRVLPRLSTPSPVLARSRGGGVGQSVTLARCGVGRGPS